MNANVKNVHRRFLMAVLSNTYLAIHRSGQKQEVNTRSNTMNQFPSSVLESFFVSLFECLQTCDVYSPPTIVFYF